MPVTSHGASIDVEIDLDATQQHLDALVDTIDARQSEYYQMPPSTQVKKNLFVLKFQSFQTNLI